jgi:hypothetical protein
VSRFLLAKLAGYDLNSIVSVAIDCPVGNGQKLFDLLNRPAFQVVESQHAVPIHRTAPAIRALVIWLEPLYCRDQDLAECLSLFEGGRVAKMAVPSFSERRRDGKR